MAMLAQQSFPPGPLSASALPSAREREYSSQPNSGTTQRTIMSGTTYNGTFASPTESEFSEAFDGLDSVKTWSEKRVGEWLRNINCGQYEATFKANNVTGANLIECDQAVLKEMGIKKIGDRVRLFVAIKGLRDKAVGNQRKRNRESMAALDSKIIFTPSSSSSPRNPLKERTTNGTTAGSKRYSRQFDPSSLSAGHMDINLERPRSPLTESISARGPRHRYGDMSPMESHKKEQSGGYFSNPASAKTTSGKRPETPANTAQTAPSSVSSRSNHSFDTTVGKLPAGERVIRVIFNNGQTKVLDVKNCKTGDEIISASLKKLNLPEQHVRNYCFWTLEGMDPDPKFCHRLSDVELFHVCVEAVKDERGRLILRKIHAGEPSEEELRRAASIALEESIDNHQTAIANNSTRNQLKIQKLTGENWDNLRQPMSPATMYPPRGPMAEPAGRSRAGSGATQPMILPKRTDSMRRAPKPIKQFPNQRPPSELITQELTTYFPEHKKEEIEKTVQASQRRSARLSRAASRLSVASNLSFASSLKDAPPLPTIADTWVNSAPNPAARLARPLSVTRFGLGNPSFRDSIISTSLQPLQEESPVEPNRKSYVSFDSASDNAAISVTDPDGNSYFGGESGSSGPSTEAGGTMYEQYRDALAEDGEGPDEELDQFLRGEAWDEMKWMKGQLIGQGSFGSVYLALHATTGELMAVKQVEMPSNSNTEHDKRKQSMVLALKREIDLLRDLQHPHIVQYLGSSSENNFFNIFLEYVPGGSVAGMLNSFGQLKEPLIRSFVRQILDGLAFLHGRDIIHRDIKGANVLVDQKGQVKISDFGISKRVEASALLHPTSTSAANARSSLQGSVYWMAPEVVKQTSYTRKADIWSLGCLIVEMFTGTHPFPNCSQLQAIFQIGNSNAKPTMPENASAEAKKFLERTFEIEWEKRPEASELLQDPFLAQTA